MFVFHGFLEQPMAVDMMPLYFRSAAFTVYSHELWFYFVENKLHNWFYWVIFILKANSESRVCIMSSQVTFISIVLMYTVSKQPHNDKQKNNRINYGNS